jgi:decaprenylphospho-beta-D-ribofuranose 2-oxidase
MYRYSVGWIDCVATGKSLGRSVLKLGNEAMNEQLPRHALSTTASPSERRHASMPFYLPSFALNKASVTAFNTAYYWRQREGVSIVDYDRYFYPLDSIATWNKMYGRRGFIQYQALVPLKTARTGLVELLEVISKSGLSSFLAVLKRTGVSGIGMLSFPFPGYTLALDIPNHGASTLRLAGELDDILLRHGGRVYLAKDATVPAEKFAVMYPLLNQFRSVKSCLDPSYRLSSSLARRLGIMS